MSLNPRECRFCGKRGVHLEKIDECEFACSLCLASGIIHVENAHRDFTPVYSEAARELAPLIARSIWWLYDKIKESNP